MKRLIFLWIVLPTMILAVRCEDDDAPTAVPSVTTLPVTNIDTNSATLSGEVTDDGNQKVTTTGFVYSSIVTEPTLADEKVELMDGELSFNALVEGLQSGASYHVRAYATNKMGIGYGAVVSFTTGNAPPTVTSINISGDAEANKTLVATYVYFDAENDFEGATSLQWYVANDGTGTGEVAIEGATEATFVIPEEHEGKYLRVGITPKATTGSANGEEVKSTFIGAVGEATTVSFMYNGKEVTYGIINSPITARKWLDRNLGAAKSPGTIDDYANFGDLFQWGRLADGHQLTVRTGLANTDIAGVNGDTFAGEPAEQSSTDIPGHSKFIIRPSGQSPYDWRNPQNDDLWQGTEGINNPCPSGWRIPTQSEFVAEGFGNLGEAFSALRITATGQRSATGDGFSFSTNGYYWTSTTDNITFPTNHQSIALAYRPSNFSSLVVSRIPGYACRCIKDQ